jgi:hypothetical protein
MKKCDENIAKLKDDNATKDKDIARKEKELAVLRQKAMRI